MHLRGAGFTLTDSLHIVWTMVSILLTLLAMGFAAAAVGVGPRFRRYCVATMVVLVLAGAMTGVYAPRVQANLPTPWAGVWERISAGVWMLWLVVLAIALLRRHAVRSLP
jgi:hypothetical protein